MRGERRAGPPRAGVQGREGGGNGPGSAGNAGKSPGSLRTELTCGQAQSGAQPGAIHRDPRGCPLERPSHPGEPRRAQEPPAQQLPAPRDRVPAQAGILEPPLRALAPNGAEQELQPGPSPAGRAPGSIPAELPKAPAAAPGEPKSPNPQILPAPLSLLPQHRPQSEQKASLLPQSRARGAEEGPGAGAQSRGLRWGGPGARARGRGSSSAAEPGMLRPGRLREPRGAPRRAQETAATRGGHGGTPEGHGGTPGGRARGAPGRGTEGVALAAPGDSARGTAGTLTGTGGTRRG